MSLKKYEGKLSFNQTNKNNNKNSAHRTLEKKGFASSSIFLFHLFESFVEKGQGSVPLIRLLVSLISFYRKIILNKEMKMLN